MHALEGEFAIDLLVVNKAVESYDPLAQFIVV